MTPAALALIGVAGAVGVLALVHGQAVRVSVANTALEDESQAFESDAWDWSTLDLYGMTTAALENHTMTRTLDDPNKSPQAAAFLAMIARSEGTDTEPDPYRVCYGYSHTINSFHDHPAVTGEWRGLSIANLGPAYAGKISTAAGRYQIIKPTWLACKSALGLTNFSPESQDRAALYLIKKRGALEDVEAGDIAVAIHKCRAEWASLPGGDSGQPQRRLAELLQAFSDAGGYLA